MKLKPKILHLNLLKKLLMPYPYAEWWKTTDDRLISRTNIAPTASSCINLVFVDVCLAVQEFHAIVFRVINSCFGGGSDGGGIIILFAVCNSGSGLNLLKSIKKHNLIKRCPYMIFTYFIWLFFFVQTSYMICERPLTFCFV